MCVIQDANYDDDYMMIVLSSMMMMMNLLSCRAFTLSNRHDTCGGHLEYKFLQPPAKPTRCLMSPITCLTLVTSGRMGRNAFTIVRRPCIEGKPSWENLSNSSQTLSRRAAVVPPETGHVGVQPTTSRKHNQHPTNCANSPLKIMNPPPKSSLALHSTPI